MKILKPEVTLLAITPNAEKLIELAGKILAKECPAVFGNVES